MKIQQDLVFDKYSGELIGYVDLGNPERNFSIFDNEDDFAAHVMAVYYGRGLTFYRMHSGLDDHPDADVVYKTINLFAPERYIYFIADAPYLMKTTRNALYHSGIRKWF